jgi:hypothetical protein
MVRPTASGEKSDTALFLSRYPAVLCVSEILPRWCPLFHNRLTLTALDAAGSGRGRFSALRLHSDSSLRAFLSLRRQRSSESS